MKKLLIVFIILSLLSGCWNRRELNELAIAMALGIDTTENQDVRLSVQVVLPQEVKDPSYFTPVTVYSEEAETIFEVFRKITTMSPRKIYLPHFRIAVISETLAKEGILDILDMLFRDHEFRSDFYIVISKKGHTAEDVLKVMTPFERIPANEKYSSLKLSEAAWAPTVAVSLDQLLRNYEAEGKEIVLTGIKITGEKSEEGSTKKNVETLDNIQMLQYSDIAVFKGDKLVGWLNEDESKGFNYIMGNVQSTVGRVPCPNGGELVLEVIGGAKSDIIPHVKNGKPNFEVKTKVTVNVAEVPCKIDLKNSDNIKKIEKNTEERQKELLQLVVTAAQEKFNSDIFGFGDAFRKKYPQEWKKIKDNWDKIFPEVDVVYNSDITVNLTGTMKQSLKKN